MGEAGAGMAASASKPSSPTLLIGQQRPNDVEGEGSHQKQKVPGNQQGEGAWVGRGRGLEPRQNDDRSYEGLPRENDTR